MFSMFPLSRPVFVPGPPCVKQLGFEFSFKKVSKKGLQKVQWSQKYNICLRNEEWSESHVSKKKNVHILQGRYLNTVFNLSAVLI